MLDAVQKQQFDDAIKGASAADLASGRRRSWDALASEVLHVAVCVEPLPDLSEVYGAFPDLGRTAQGTIQYREMLAWLDEHGISDPGRRDAYVHLWRVMESEQAAVIAETLKAN